MLNIQKLKGPHGEALVGVQSVEIIDVVGLLRNFKQQYPQEWRAVNYEIATPRPVDRPPIVDGDGGEQLSTDTASHAAHETDQPSAIIVDTN